MESHEWIVTSGELGCRLCLFLCGAVPACVSLTLSGWALTAVPAADV